MKILFLTMSNFDSVRERGIYTDLIRALERRGHHITALCPIEKKYRQHTHEKNEDGIRLIRVRTGDLFNVGLVRKLLSRAGVCHRYRAALDRFCPHEEFDLVLYTTPPTTLAPIVRRLKKTGAYTYLMLKDIFPQNAADLGLIRQNGLAFRFFRHGEKSIYKAADTIGCMSPANMDFLKRQDPWIDESKITECPNAVEVREASVTAAEKATIRAQYNLPADRCIFVYGGGLGKPQGTEFLQRVATATDCDLFFLIIGSGACFDDLKKLEAEKPATIRVLSWLPTDDYDRLVRACDVGLILLNPRFTIPNFPSRLLGYMQAKLPVLAATDTATDIGRIAEAAGFGLWCENGDVDGFLRAAKVLTDDARRAAMGARGFDYLCRHYSADIVADRILDRVHTERN